MTTNSSSSNLNQTSNKTISTILENELPNNLVSTTFANNKTRAASFQASSLPQKHLKLETGSKSNTTLYIKPHLPSRESVHWAASENDSHETSCISHNNTQVLAIRGRQQSPINILSRIVSSQTEEYAANKEYESQINICIKYPEYFNNCTIVNTGYTVRVNIVSDINDCGCLHLYNKKYILQQFHFHSPSEHMIDATPFDIEMHLVHVCADDDSIAVLAFLFNSSNRAVLKRAPKLSMRDIVDNDSQSSVVNDDQKSDFVSKKRQLDNDFFEQFMDELPLEVNDKSPIKLSNALSMDYLFETSAKEFKKHDTHLEVEMDIFHYEGSLTTPPCTEGVKWLVVKVPQWASNEQIHKLKACWKYMSNARPVQSYHGRAVTMSSKLAIH